MLQDFFKNNKLARYIGIAIVVAIAIGVVVLCRSCSPGKVSERLHDDFTQEEIDSWGKPEQKFDMHGGYYIHFGGVDYPVVFENGEIIQFENSPKELAFVSMNKLYFDSELTKLCCYYGHRYENILFWSAESDGYVLEDKRPAFGTVLYLDETKEIEIKIGDRYYLPDDEIEVPTPEQVGLYSVRDVVLWYGYGREVNTCRKIYERVNEINATSKECRYYGYKSLPDIFESSSNYIEERMSMDKWYSKLDILDAFDFRSLKYEPYAVLSPVRKTDPITDTIITLHYNNEHFSDEYVRYIKDSFTADDVEDNADYSEIKTDSEGNVLEYKDCDGRIIRVVHSSFDVSPQLIDYKNNKAISFFCGDSYYSYKIGSSECGLYYSNWYAVWKDCKILVLHSNEDTELAVFQDKATELPSDLNEPGYEFEGWYTDENFGGNKITKVLYNDGITNVYAKLKKVDYYTLTFEPYEGIEFEDITYSYGEEKSLPILTKSFYIFKGWCTDKDCKTPPIKIIKSDFYGNYRCMRVLKR